MLTEFRRSRRRVQSRHTVIVALVVQFPADGRDIRTAFGKGQLGARRGIRLFGCAGLADSRGTVGAHSQARRTYFGDSASALRVVFFDYVVEAHE